MTALFAPIPAVSAQPTREPAQAKAKPGLFHRLPFPEYLAIQALSQSVLQNGRNEFGSMKHLQAAINGESATKVTDNMILGQAMHTAFLEPDQAEDRIAIWTGEARKGKDWEQFKAENGGRIILTRTAADNLAGMVKALRDDDQIQKWMKAVQQVEMSCVGSIQRLPFKGRCDALMPAVIADLKMIPSVDERAVDERIWEFGYHIQGWIYTKLFNRPRYALAFVESDSPWDVRTLELSPEWLKLGEKEAIGIIEKVKFCRKKYGEKPWPGRYQHIDVIKPPEWVAQKFVNHESITIGGKTAEEAGNDGG